MQKRIQFLSTGPSKAKSKPEVQIICFRVISPKGAFVFNEPDIEEGKVTERLQFGTFFFADRVLANFAETKFGWVCLKASGSGYKMAVEDPIVRSMEQKSDWTTNVQCLRTWQSDLITHYDRITISCIIYSFLFKQVAHGHASQYQKDVLENSLNTKRKKEELGDKAIQAYPLSWPFFEVEIVDMETRATILLRQAHIPEQCLHALDILTIVLRSHIPSEYHVQPEHSRWWGSNNGRMAKLRIDPTDHTIDYLREHGFYNICIELQRKSGRTNQEIHLVAG